MKYLNINTKFLFVLFFTFVSGISGLIYNTQLNNSWYIKYRIGMNTDIDAHSNIIDQMVADLKVGYGTGSIIVRAQQKISNIKLVKDKRMSNFVIKPDTIAFNVFGSMDGIEAEVEQIVKRLNIELKKEINNFLDIFVENATLSLKMKQNEKIKILKNEIQFYESKPEFNSDIFGDTVKGIEDILNSNLDKNLKDNFEKTILLLKKIELQNLLLSSKKRLNNILKEDIQSKRELLTIIDKKNNIISQDIFFLINRIEEVNLKPRKTISLLSFSIVGFLISIVLINIFSLIKSENKKHILKFFNIN